MGCLSVPSMASGRRRTGERRQKFALVGAGRAADRRQIGSRRNSPASGRKVQRTSSLFCHSKSNKRFNAWRTRTSAKNGRRVLNTKPNMPAGTPVVKLLFTTRPSVTAGKLYSRAQRPGSLSWIRRNSPFLKALEKAVAVPVKLEAHFVEIIQAAIQRQIAPPIIRGLRRKETLTAGLTSLTIYGPLPMGATSVVRSNVAGSIRCFGSTGMSPMISGISRSPPCLKTMRTPRSPMRSVRATLA